MDIAFWKKSGQKKITKKITQLLEDILAHPYSGLGKPEQLKYELTGFWSRRINDEHRLIYKVDEEEQIVSIRSLRGHY